jgi:hypothetical protein
MTDHCRDARDTVIERFAIHAKKVFDADATRQSAMLVVAQYWNDSANDEVHADVIVSTRATPVWPHECEYDYSAQPSEQRPLFDGERCYSCGGSDVEMQFYGGYGDAVVGAFEVFCRESAHQGMDRSEAYTPFAIARRVGERVEVEVVGHPQRPPGVMIGSARGGAEWPDARARALFEEVCRHAADDAPRAVLSDYLLEQHPNDPRGEAIALALAGELDDETCARRDKLLAKHWERWMFPLGDVIVPGCAHFERGFLARCDVFAETDVDRDRVLGAPAWGTVHTIRFAPNSRDVIASKMTGLRDVGPLRDEGVEVIARAQHPWAIEVLRVDNGDVDRLLRAKSLPKLRELELASSFRDWDEVLSKLHAAPWRAGLQRLGFVALEYGSLADWRALRARCGVPELSIAFAPYWSFVASSWQFRFRADDSVAVRLAAWHGAATMLRLAEQLGELPPDTRIVLESSSTRVITDADVTWLRDYTGRRIASN